MQRRVIHKVLGLLLLLPLLIWALSGAVFFIKPGYQAAFAPLMVKTYPLDSAMVVTPQPEWQELRLLHTVLGHHLLVKKNEQYRHLDADTLQPAARPTQAQLRLLLDDAISTDPERYGRLSRLDNRANQTTGYTSTGVELTFDWNRLQLRQQGGDTRLINGVYRMHYLQWTPYTGLNQVLGFLGLALLLALALSGGFLLLRTPRD